MQKVDVQIREATLADASILAKLGARTFFEAFAADNSLANMTQYVNETFNDKKIAAELADGQGCFLLAELNGRPIGYARLLSGSREAGVTGRSPVELVRLYVLRGWIGHGVGSALMLATLDHARQKQHDTIWLGVWEHNERAIAFYKEWKFQVIGSHLFELGQEMQTDILMQRPLAEHLPVDADLLEKFRRRLDTAVKQLAAIDSREALKIPAGGGWSAKQILGHLIDSAIHNHLRIVEAQLKDDLVFPGYDQENWVQIQQYQKASWKDLVDLWYLGNRHLINLIATIPRPELERPRHPHSLDQIAVHPVDAAVPATLALLIQDYFDHMQAHLDQIQALLNA